uniref:Pinin_SDK_memA domain-containing protein n=1 Tax=Elaeophora elaphi TaxID=1147741 RepID=A0A0R3S7A6_9BILA
MSQARVVSRTASANEARACYDLLTQAQTYLQRAKAQDEEEQRQRQRQEEERQALKRQQEQEAKEREEKAKRELEVLKQMRQEYVEKTKEILRLPTYQINCRFLLFPVKSREFVQSDESSSDENTNKPSKSRLSDDSDAAGSPELEKIAGSDSSAAEDATRRTDSDDESDNGQPKTKYHVTNNADQSSAESSTEDRARSPSDSDDDEVEKTSVKATRRKRIVSSDEDGSENNEIVENNIGVGDSGGDEDCGFAIADDD